MKVTVILCTYNRCQSLATALKSVANSLVPESIEWEVLVVDNNSKDTTREIVQDFCANYPRRFRYLFEAQQGKSYALNSGIRETDADVLAFMDDDVEVDRHWLHNLTKVFLNSPWSGVGGRILLEAGFVPPQWIETSEPYALAPLALFDLGADGKESNEPPFGTNMAFRREMFLKYGGFRTDLGPRPGSEIRSEDTEFGSRLLAAGEHFWYEPSAVVYHLVPRERVQREYFLTWWFDKARAEVREDRVRRRSMLYVSGVPLSLFRTLCVWTLRWMCSVDPARRFSCKLNVWKTAGRIQEYHHQSKRVSTPASTSVSEARPVRPTCELKRSGTIDK
jgi:glycosyltransferase involved in cell wall biosynthesis